MTDEIQATWQEFAKSHAFAFRSSDPALYEIQMPGILRAIIARSTVETIQAPDGQLLACLIYERPEGSDMTTVHWAWTHPKQRNTGKQKELWLRAGISPDSLVVISLLTVVSERMKDKYGWSFAPFSLYKGAA